MDIGILFSDRTCEGPFVVEVGRAQTRSDSFTLVSHVSQNIEPFETAMNVTPTRMPTKLFVGGIPFRMTDEELRQHFAQAGEVVSVFIPTDRMTGRPRGFAFVEMTDDAAADKAISMFNNSDMGGRSIAVNRARPMEERGPRS